MGCSPSPHGDERVQDLRAYAFGERFAVMQAARPPSIRRTADASAAPEGVSVDYQVVQNHPLRRDKPDGGGKLAQIVSTPGRDDCLAEPRARL